MMIDYHLQQMVPEKLDIHMQTKLDIYRFFPYIKFIYKCMEHLKLGSKTLKLLESETSLAR